jgi:hypothetical protein
MGCPPGEILWPNRDDVFRFTVGTPKCPALHSPCAYRDTVSGVLAQVPVETTKKKNHHAAFQLVPTEYDWKISKSPRHPTRHLFPGHHKRYLLE